MGMAYVGGPGYWAQCNVMTIETQLKSGIRAFDIRLRPTGGRLAIHHGAYFQKKMFGDFLNAAKAFLKANPGEVLLVRHQMEHSDDNDAYEKAWAGYYNTNWSDEKFVVIRKSPGISSKVTLGEVRGKILFHETIEMGFGGY